MTTLVKIGNSKGVRIPKPLIRQTGLEDADIEFVVVEEGLLLKPVKRNARKEWADNIDAVLSRANGEGDDGLIRDFLNDDDLPDWEW